MIFLVVVSSRLVGGSSTGQLSCLEMEKSPRLKGSAMFACVGTRCSIWRRHSLLRHVQCEPMRLFKGAWLPDPLMMACVAASLSHSWMYVEVKSGLIKMGVMIAAQASRKYMKALLLAKCLRSLGGTVPWNTKGVFADGWKTTAAHPFVISGEGVSSCSWSYKSEHRSSLSPSL